MFQQEKKIKHTQRGFTYAIMYITHASFYQVLAAKIITAGINNKAGMHLLGSS